MNKPEKRMDIHIHLEKKHFVGFLVVISVILFGGVGYAVVSHNADQIFFEDGVSLEARLGAGEQDPTVLESVKDGVSWSEVTGIPSGFSDGEDNVGVTTESDPTVLESVKDGVSWSEVSGKPGSYPPSAHNQAWNTITSKPTFASDINNNRVKMKNVGCSSSWGSSCDSNTNGWSDYADSAGSATSATSAGYANNAGAVDGIDSSQLCKKNGGDCRYYTFSEFVSGTLNVAHDDPDGWYDLPGPIFNEDWYTGVQFSMCALSIAGHDGSNGGYCKVEKSGSEWYLRGYKWGSGGLKCEARCFMVRY